MGGPVEQSLLRVRRCFGVLLVLSALLTVLMMPLASPASLLDLAPQGQKSSAEEGRQDFTLEGKFELAKVRVLGVPAISIASPVPLGDTIKIDASTRARVIEGNLKALYDPNQLCTFSERLSEWILDSLLAAESNVCASGQRYGLNRTGQPVRIVVLREANGAYELAARLPGREQPFPLLTITEADADINGSQQLALAQVWRQRLESRVNYARRLYAPELRIKRLQLILIIELVLVLLFLATALVWNRCRVRTLRVHRQLQEQPSHQRWQEMRLCAEQALGIAVLLLLFSELVLMLAFGVLTIPGQVPLALELTLQPLFGIGKAVVATMAAFLLRSLTTFLLSQWSADVAVDVPQQELERRQQRYRSLRRVSHRLIDVSAILFLLVWILLDIPGVRDTSVSLVLAGGALLGALAFVFQGLLRDFIVGLVILMEDRFAIGDWIEVDGNQGQVTDLRLFSTHMRCLDQRMCILDNASIQQVRNHTKLRSGSLVTFVISHRQTNLEIVYRTLALEIDAFCADPVWGSRLLSDPVLRGIKRTTALGVQMQVLLVTKAGEQWATEREFQRRVLQAFHRRGVQMADGLELGGLLPSEADRG